MNELMVHVLGPLRDTIYPEMVRLAPRLAAAVLLVALAWVVAGTARWIARRAARTEWLERLPLRSGVLSGLVEPSLAEPRRLVANVTYWCILLAGAAAALAVLSDQIAMRLGSLFLILLPKMILAAAIIIGASWLGRYWSRSVLIWMTNEGIPSPWRPAAMVRIAVSAAGIALASEATGFATTLVRWAFLILLAGGTFAAAHAVSPIIRGQLMALLDRKAREHADEHLLR